MQQTPVRGVVALRGEFQPEIVSQDDLSRLVQLQRARWLMGRKVAIASENIKAAIERGAHVEEGPLKYDREMEWVEL